MLDDTGPAGRVPHSLYDSLMSGLDRLGPARGLAQRLSVLGPSFDVADLQFVAGESDDTELRTQVATMVQAGVYSGLTHYLKAVAELKSGADGKAVVAKMKETPTDDTLFGKGTIRADGRKVHDAYLYEVKKPEESKYPGDFYKVRATIPADQAFRPLKEGGCSLVSG